MKLPRVRFTVRRMMIVVAVVGLVIAVDRDQKRKSKALKAVETAYLDAKQSREGGEHQLRKLKGDTTYKGPAVKEPAPPPPAVALADEVRRRDKVELQREIQLLSDWTDSWRKAEQSKKSELDRIRSSMIWPYR
jgi:hypothetical protein